jgi:hypothetical protein
MYKKCICLLLPTNKKASLMLFKGVHPYELNYYREITDATIVKEFTENQHLYIISDEEIKAGDWYVCLLNKLVFPASKRHGQLLTDRKVLASTDSSLRVYTNPIINGTRSFKGGIPSISQSFIDKYINFYNQGNIITEVLVEYERDVEPKGSGSMWSEDEDFVMEYLKLNLDNTININSIKDSWTRDEVIKLIQRFVRMDKDTFNKWIETNL